MLMTSKNDDDDDDNDDDLGDDEVKMHYYEQIIKVHSSIRIDPKLLLEQS